ncbi:RidA family protein [Dyadobacter sp. CY345]|uniref:RidA family protein n=1 Tax=Dyadobacter sp. CY345 TaxID=2909335 RepID=UPI001F246C24|nr:RidA family protein [Dyadobacter sp. CY345]MCF2446613.1 RidA family protein [Dyadobacter sp. CY345]
MKSKLSFVILLLTGGCNPAPETKQNISSQSDAPEYFSLRPGFEKSNGYSHAVRIGSELKISGAVSMDEDGNLTAPGDMKQQMINCYGDLEKVLNHYGYSWEDVVVENVLTTNMAEFEKHSVYRKTIYGKQFPAGSWFGVKELALPGQLIEIELEAYKPR